MLSPKVLLRAIGDLSLAGPSVGTVKSKLCSGIVRLRVRHSTRKGPVPSTAGRPGQPPGLLRSVVPQRNYRCNLGLPLIHDNCLYFVLYFEIPEEVGPVPPVETYCHRRVALRVKPEVPQHPHLEAVRIARSLHEVADYLEVQIDSCSGIHPEHLFTEVY